MKKLVTDIAERLNPCHFSIIDNDLYLTDCKIAFRIPGAAGLKPECVTAEVDAKTMGRTFACAKETGKSVALESIELVKAAPTPCDDCEGTGKDKNGDKAGDNFFACEKCQGIGIMREPVALFGRKYDVRLLRIIAAVAPEAVMFTPISTCHPAYFKAEKVDGLIQNLMGV